MSVEKVANGVANSVEASWPKIRRDVETLGKDIAKVGERHFSDGQAAMADEIAKLRDGLSELLNRMSEKAQPQFDSALDLVRRRPVAALAGIFAAGLITAALFSRKSS